MMTKINTILKASFAMTTFDPAVIRTIREWKQQAIRLGLRNGKAAAKQFAGTYGASVVTWSNGHAALYVQDQESGDLIRINFVGPVDFQNTQTSAPTIQENVFAQDEAETVG